MPEQIKPEINWSLSIHFGHSRLNMERLNNALKLEYILRKMDGSKISYPWELKPENNFLLIWFLEKHHGMDV